MSGINMKQFTLKNLGYLLLLAALVILPFALALDQWTCVSAPLPPEPGTVRLTLRVAQPRVPKERIPGAGDERPLGVAVRRLFLA